MERTARVTSKYRPILLTSAVFCILKENCNAKNIDFASERPFKILQNETKIINIGQAVLEIFNFKDRDLDNFTRKNHRKPENVVF